MGRVKDTAVLDVDAVSDADRMIVAAKHRVVPDAAVFLKGDIADDSCAFRNISHSLFAFRNRVDDRLPFVIRHIQNFHELVNIPAGKIEKNLGVDDDAFLFLFTFHSIIPL
jgi:hypothetical protein